MWNFMSCTQLQERLPPQKIGRKNNNYNCICSSPQRLPGAIECSVGPHPLQNFKPERNNWKQIAYSVTVWAVSQHRTELSILMDPNDTLIPSSSIATLIETSNSSNQTYMIRILVSFYQVKVLLLHITNQLETQKR